MVKKSMWGLGVFILFFIGFMFYIQYDYAKFKEGFKVSREKPNIEDTVAKPDTENTVTEVDIQPIEVGEAPEGNGHFHADGTWHEGTHENVSFVSPEQLTEAVYPRPNYPVKALREFLEKRGHWSAKWIPDFPPDDEEAAQMAYYYMVMIQHTDAGNEYYDGPALIPDRETREMLKRYKYDDTERAFDMYKLSWSILDTPIEDPESFNVHGFDKEAFEKERAERREAEKRSSAEKAIRERAAQEEVERSIEELLRKIDEEENR